MNTQPTTRDRLLAVAIKRFAELGFHRTSVRDICDRARANPGAVSYHFGGKSQLRRAAVRHAVETLASTLTDELSGDSPLSSPTLVEAVSRHPSEVRLLLRDLADGGQLLAEAAPPLLRDRLSPERNPVDPESSDDLRLRRLETLQTIAAALLVSLWPFLDRHFRISLEERVTLCDAIRSSNAR